MMINSYNDFHSISSMNSSNGGSSRSSSSRTHNNNNNSNSNSSAPAIDNPVMMAASPSDSIGPNDVLCGRGGATNNHIGNKRFRNVVADFQQEYLQAKKKDKVVISRRIVSIIHGRGGRFLKRCPERNIWVQVPLKKATEKTSQALREGLDVRHKTIRPEKMPRRYSDSSEESPRKRARLIEGAVLSTPTTNAPPPVTTDENAYPATSSMDPQPVAIKPEPSLQQDMPDLRDEKPIMPLPIDSPDALFLRMPPPPLISSPTSEEQQQQQQQHQQQYQQQQQQHQQQQNRDQQHFQPEPFAIPQSHFLNIEQV